MSLVEILLIVGGVVGIVGCLVWRYPQLFEGVAEIGGDIVDIASSIGGDGGDGGDSGGGGGGC